jgi:hypothetical protein
MADGSASEVLQTCVQYMEIPLVNERCTIHSVLYMVMPYRSYLYIRELVYTNQALGLMSLPPIGSLRLSRLVRRGGIMRWTDSIVVCILIVSVWLLSVICMTQHSYSLGQLAIV